MIVSTTSTTVGLRWNAWSEEDDTGDSPLVGYVFFVNQDGDWVTEQRVDQLTTSVIVSNLTPDTDYMFRVAAVREGTGGTGPVSPSSKAITRCRSKFAQKINYQISQGYVMILECRIKHLKMVIFQSTFVYKKLHVLHYK